jgi:hypothetical protein
MIAGAPGAKGSLVSLSSSGEIGWNPVPAFASGAANIHIASPNTTNLLKRNIAISPEVNTRFNRGVENDCKGGNHELQGEKERSPRR